MTPEKRHALTRRANMLIARLKRSDHAVYENHESTLQLVKLIDLIVWALERSLPYSDWDDFREAFLGARFMLVDTFETEIAETNAYNSELESVVKTLEKYRDFITSNEIADVQFSE
jgi:hypothetical protein